MRRMGAPHRHRTIAIVNVFRGPIDDQDSGVFMLTS